MNCRKCCKNFINKANDVVSK